MKKTESRGWRGSRAGQIVEKRYIVEWKCKDGGTTSRTLKNLPKAKGYAAEFCKIAQDYIDNGHDKDGSMSAAIKSVRIYEATLRECRV